MGSAAAGPPAAATPPAAAASSMPPPPARKARRERSGSSMLLSCRSETVMSDRVGFVCNGAPVELDVAPGESLLSVLRERLGLVSAKDGCAPQGQCGCCTVLVDGDARVACVTPVARVSGRAVTTVEGLDADTRDALAAAFPATGPCGPAGGGGGASARGGRGARRPPARAGGPPRRAAVDRGLAAHLCRCTGWQTVYAAVDAAAGPRPVARRDLEAASRRAALEGGGRQRVGLDVPLGGGGVADDLAPRDAPVAVPRPAGPTRPTVDRG